MFRRPEPEEALLSRTTVDRPAASLESQRPRRQASLFSARTWQQLGKFCVVGAVGYGINVGVYHTLLGAGMHYLAAATCSFLVAVTSNYTWNRLWTFRDQRGHLGIQGTRFLIVSLVALGANLLVLDLLVHLGGVDKFVANAIAIPLVTPLNFIGNKLWSFRHAEQ
jgi:putative flippase GtrA